MQLKAQIHVLPAMQKMSLSCNVFVLRKYRGEPKYTQYGWPGGFFALQHVVFG
jgi:hypothetical protein